MLVLRFTCFLCFDLLWGLFDPLWFCFIFNWFAVRFWRWSCVWLMCSAQNRRSWSSATHRTANEKRAVRSVSARCKFQHDNSKPAMFVELIHATPTYHKFSWKLGHWFEENVLFAPFKGPLLVATDCLSTLDCGEKHERIIYWLPTYLKPCRHTFFPVCEVAYFSTQSTTAFFSVQILFVQTGSINNYERNLYGGLIIFDSLW